MREEPRSHRPIAELAKRQHGIISIWQLAKLGFSKDEISRETSKARLHQIHHGVYAVGHTALSRQGHCAAAVLSCGNGALLSHRSAAWLWGLTKHWPPMVEVTAASPRETRPAIRVHSAAALVSEDESESEGILATAVPRTLLDYAAVEPHFLGGAVERAERLDLLDLIAIDALLKRSRGFRGVARLREALEIYRTPAFTRSRLERRFLALVRSAGLPRPSMTRFVAGYELDAYWPAERFAVELDTYDHHGGHVAFEKDRLRQEDLKLAGIEMTRVTGARLDREPAAVVTRLSRLLSQRRRDLGAPERARTAR
jgi:predicted transcriptional regulator of viral defense system/very-short-patch-repair endonuclease